MVFGSATTRNSWPAAEGRWRMPWGTVFLRQFRRVLGPRVGSPVILMAWNGLLSPWQFPLGFHEPGRSDLGSTKIKEFLAGLWKHSLLAVCLPLWTAWKRFPCSAKEEPHCRADSKQPSGWSLCTQPWKDQEWAEWRSRADGQFPSKKGLIWANYWVFTNAESMPTELA